MQKKKVMRIGMAGRNVTYSGNYRVNWGSSGSAYNNQSRGFNTRKTAITFKNKLIKKFKPKHKVRYMYISD